MLSLSKLSLLLSLGFFMFGAFNIYDEVVSGVFIVHQSIGIASLFVSVLLFLNFRMCLLKNTSCKINTTKKQRF